MPRITGTFAADGDVSRELLLEPNQSFFLSLTASPSLTGSVQLLQRELSTMRSTVLQTFTATQAGTEYVNRTGGTVAVRLFCVNLDAGTETVAYVLQSLISTGRQVLIDHRPKVGATAGWVINAADDIALMATLAQSRTANTLVVPIDNLQLGDRITGFYPVGRVASAGNTATLTMNLRRQTAGAASIADASLISTGAISFTANTELGRVGALAMDQLDVQVGVGQSHYFLLTGTTAASTTFALQGIMLQIRRQTIFELNAN
jgi:hypothetical protein